MNDEQTAALKAKISEWRAKAQPSGPQHSLWDRIFDAEALIEGKRTLMSGTPNEVYAKLMAD